MRRWLSFQSREQKRAYFREGAILAVFMAAAWVAIFVLLLGRSVLPTVVFSVVLAPLYVLSPALNAYRRWNGDD